MRADLAQALADMHPGVFRFPGGCIVEGADLQTRYQWKNTIGPVENRPVNENRWQYAMKSRISPDYYQSYGLGFFEYFQLSEDIGASRCLCSTWAWHASFRTRTTAPTCL